MVATKSPVKRILAALGALDAANEPMGRLQAARRLREAAEQLEAAQVEAARKAGATWIDIGACYGLTKQGASNASEVPATTPSPPRPLPWPSPARRLGPWL